MSRNLVEDHRVTPENAKRLQRQMATAFPDAAVEDWALHERACQNDRRTGMSRRRRLRSART
jgi:hypothetical protein